MIILYLSGYRGERIECIGKLVRYAIPKHWYDNLGIPESMGTASPSEY